MILDPLRALHTKNENASEEMEAFWYVLRERLIREHGLTVVVAHHLRKGARADGEAARGGSYQENVATSWLLTTKNPGSDELTLMATKTRNGPPIPRLQLTRSPEALWHAAREVATELGQDGLLGQLDRAAVLLGEAAAPVRNVELAADLGLKGRAAAEALWSALEGDPRFHCYRSTERGNPKVVALAAGLGAL